MLEARNLSYRYHSRAPWVLRDHSLQLMPGEVAGMRGASGLGKTTLARLLAGYLNPTTGQVLLDAAPLPVKGFCPVQLILQHPELALNPRWTIERSLRESGDETDHLQRRLGIEPGWLPRYPHELSGGELQRVAIARALRPGLRYLICDEISAMLDALTQAQLWHTVRNYARENNIGLLVISHNQALLEQLCARVIPLPARRADTAD